MVMLPELQPASHLGTGLVRTPPPTSTEPQGPWNQGATKATTQWLSSGNQMVTTPRPHAPTSPPHTLPSSCLSVWPTPDAKIRKVLLIAKAGREQGRLAKGVTGTLRSYAGDFSPNTGRVFGFWMVQINLFVLVFSSSDLSSAIDLSQPQGDLWLHLPTTSPQGGPLPVAFHRPGQ